MLQHEVIVNKAFVGLGILIYESIVKVVEAEEEPEMHYTGAGHTKDRGRYCSPCPARLESAAQAVKVWRRLKPEVCNRPRKASHGRVAFLAVRLVHRRKLQYSEDSGCVL